MGMQTHCASVRGSENNCGVTVLIVTERQDGKQQCAERVRRVVPEAGKGEAHVQGDGGSRESEVCRRNSNDAANF